MAPSFWLVAEMREKDETGSSVLLSPKPLVVSQTPPPTATTGCFLTLALQIGGEQYLWCERTGERVLMASTALQLVPTGNLGFQQESGSGQGQAERGKAPQQASPTHVTARVMTGAGMGTRSDGSPFVGTSQARGDNDVLITSVGFQSGGPGFRRPLDHLTVCVTVSELLTSPWTAIVTPRDRGPDPWKLLMLLYLEKGLCRRD